MDYQQKQVKKMSDEKIIQFTMYAVAFVLMIVSLGVTTPMILNSYGLFAFSASLVVHGGVLTWLFFKGLSVFN